jgi:hypothetical protein
MIHTWEPRNIFHSENKTGIRVYIVYKVLEVFNPICMVNHTEDVHRKSDEDATLMVRVRSAISMLNSPQKYRKQIINTVYRILEISWSRRSAQDVFVRVRAASDYQPEARFSTWFTILRNVCSNYRTRQEGWIVSSIRRSIQPRPRKERVPNNA